MTDIIQPSFAKGVLSPELFGRVDTTAYDIGLALGDNAIVHTYGGVSSRPGTRFIGPVADHSYTPRLISFRFKTEDQYVLEFGQEYMRVIRDDGNVLFTRDYDITGATQANPVVITATGHDFVNGMTVEIQNVVGMTELNGNQYTVANAATDTFELSGVDGTSFTAYDEGGEATQVVNVEGATNTSPIVITATAHGFSENDEVFFRDVGGMTELNNNRYYIANVTADTFELTNQVTGADVDGTGFGIFTSGGTVAVIYEIQTPYQIEDLFEINFTQTADVMTLVHPKYRIRELSRFDNDDWRLEELVIGPEIDTPADIVVTVGTTGTETDRYRVTSLAREDQEESLPGLDDTEQLITGATQADPVVITSVAHGLIEGDDVQIDNVVGMTELNGNRYVVSNPTADTFELTSTDGDPIDGTTFDAYVSDGIIRRTFVEVTNSNGTRNNTITWTAVQEAGRYAVYRRDNGVYGFLGETELTTFEDNNISPDLALSPPQARNPFFDADDQPAAVGFFEQRRVFGGSFAKPDTSEFSQTGRSSNFNKTQPLQQDDAITATLDSQQVNAIRHYFPKNDLVTFTAGNEWAINSGPDQAFAADTIKQRQQTSYGIDRIRPLVVGNTLLYITEGLKDVRSIGYSLQLDGYTGANLNILSDHLFSGFQLLDWSNVTHPESRLHIVRDDGAALAFSFDQEQEVTAWAPWFTSGDFEATTSLRGGGDNDEDSTYFVVRRDVNDLSVRYIEVSRDLFFDDVRDCFYVDSGLTLDDPKAITNVELTNPIVITAPAHGFVDDDEVDIFDIVWTPDPTLAPSSKILIEEPDPNTFDPLNGGRYTVQNATTDTFELKDEDGTTINRQYVEGGTARKAVSNLFGLEHLEGRDVDCLADGNVVTGLTVEDGQLTLPRKASRVQVGLNYVTDIETLNVEIPQGTVQGRFKKVSKVTLRFYKSRGLFVGPDRFNLVEWKQREFERYGEPTRLKTGDAEIRLLPDWNTKGRVFMRQPFPLPLTLLAVVASYDFGEET